MKTIIDLQISAKEYYPGEILKGACRLPNGIPADATEIELSMVRFVNRDDSSGIESALERLVPEFQAWTDKEKTLSKMLDPQPFEFVLPADGQTYLSKGIKIEWLVRVRVRFGSSNQDCVKDAMFKLLPPMRVS